MLSLKDRVVVVTGGGSGIGRAISLATAAYGARVVVNDFRPGDGENTAADTCKQINALGGEAIPIASDVASFAGGRTIIESAVDAFGAVDGLIMCAGNFYAESVLETTEEHWDAQLAVHAKGHFACAQAAARSMVDRGQGGSIVTFASRGAFFSPLPAYSAAKGAIMALTSSLAAGLSEYGIRVNCVLPSAQTQLFPGNDPTRRTFGGLPATESLEPGDVAPLAVYLTCEESADISGQFIYMSGGDMCVYTRPLESSGGIKFLRKAGGWTAEEIGEVLPAVLAP